MLTTNSLPGRIAIYEEYPAVAATVSLKCYVL
jgi:hypothetical protein